MKIKASKKQDFNLGTSQQRQQFFAFTWALAIMIDEARQPIRFDSGQLASWLSVVVFFTAAFLVRKPSSNPVLLILSALNILQLALAFPITTNHSTILGLTNILILAIAGFAKFKDKKLTSGFLYNGFPALRLAFLIMYGSAAISKINSDFLFNLENSCATDLAAEELYWLPFALDFKSFAFLPFLIAGAELLVFLLPIFEKTRFAGIIFAVLFHTALSLTADSKGPGFTLVLFALLGLFLTDGAARSAHDTVRTVHRWIRRYVEPWFLNFVWVLFLLIQANISFIEGWPGYGWWRWSGTLAVNIIWGFILIRISWKFRHDKLGQRVAGFYGPLSFIVIGIVLLNSASPYLGGKTTSSMTMYSNLKVEGGESNHYLFPRLPIKTPQDEIVTLIRVADPYLKEVMAREAKITMHELVRVLSMNPEQPIEYDFKGKRILLRQASDRPELVAYDPFWHKFIGHRLISDKCVW